MRRSEGGIRAGMARAGGWLDHYHRPPRPLRIRTDAEIAAFAEDLNVVTDDGEVCWDVRDPGRRFPCHGRSHPVGFTGLD